MSFTLTFISRDWGEIGAEEEGEKRGEAPRYKERQREASGQTWGLVFSIAGGRVEHVLISHNATHYVISHYALCQRFTSFHSFPPSLSSYGLSPSSREQSKGRGGGCAEGRDCLSYFCTDEPEAAANLPLRTSAKSPQESCA